MTAILLALLAALAAAPAAAAPAISCHCFRDRSFDPARPEAADPYVLATAQNSFLAAAFGVPKRDVVQSKMTGTAGDDLWAAHGLAEQTRLKPAELLHARARAGSWRAALRQLGVAPERLDPALATAAGPGAADGDLARVIVDRTLVARLGAAPEGLEALRAAGASNAQTVAAVVLGGLTGRAPAEVFREVAAGRATWGALFHAAGVEPGAIEDAIRARLRP